METSLLEFQSKLAYTTLEIQRYLIDYIDLNNRLIVIKVARRTEKKSHLL